LLLSAGYIISAMWRKPFQLVWLVAMVCAAAATTAAQAAAQDLKQVPAEEAAQHIVSRVEPKYPLLAQTAGIQGDVILRVTIDEAGRVREANPVSGHPLLIEAAVPAVKNWRFEPFLDHGTPVPVSSQVKVMFALGPGAELRGKYLQQEVECTKHIFSKSFSAGEAVCGKALETAVKLPHGFASDKMRAYGNAGTIAYELKKFGEALEDFQQQLDFAQRALQPGNPQMIQVRGNVAHACVAADRLSEADAQYTEAEKAVDAAGANLEDRRGQLKPEAFASVKASYARSRQAILQEHAALLRKMGKTSEAEILEQRAGSSQENK